MHSTTPIRAFVSSSKFRILNGKLPYLAFTLKRKICYECIVFIERFLFQLILKSIKLMIEKKCLRSHNLLDLWESIQTPLTCRNTPNRMKISKERQNTSNVFCFISTSQQIPFNLALKCVVFNH